MKFILNEKVYLPVVYIIIGVVIFLILKRITNRLTKNIKSSKVVNKRKNTIVALINNLIKYLIAIFIILSILKVYGVDTSSIVASLGIAAVIIGLAFQDIIKDLLAGIFIIFDNQYAVGDYIKVNGFFGEVIDLGLKTTKVKAYATGEVLVISNSMINEVINYNLSTTNLVLDVNVSYNTDIDLLEEVLLSLNDKIKELEETNGDLKLLGVDKLDSSSIVYKILIPCKPMTQFTLKRKVLKLVKQTLDKNNIEIPYNKLDVNIKK